MPPMRLSVIGALVCACGMPPPLPAPTPGPALAGSEAARPVPATAIPAALSKEEKIYGLSLLWKEASYNFAYFDQVPDLDWDAAYRAALPRVATTRNDLEYYRELQRFYALLEDGHTNVFLPKHLEALLDAPPISLDDIENHVIVDNIATSLSKQIPLGSVLTQVDGVSVEDLLAREVLPLVSADDAMRRRMAIWGWGKLGLLIGPAGSQLSIAITTPTGETRTVEVSRNGGTEQRWTRTQAPRPALEVEALEGGIALVAINSFGNREVVDLFAAKFGELRKATGIIIDVRANGGGNSGHAARIVERVTGKPFRSSAWRTRSHVAAYKAWGSYAERNPGQDPAFDKLRPYARGDAWLEEAAQTRTPPRGAKLTVPIVVLLGSRTASAAEDFLVMLDSVRRAVLVGEPSFGSTGQPLDLVLPGGGSARICTKRDVFPDGREFVGYGIQPHVRVQRTIEGLRSGRDEVLERGVEVLRERIAAGRRAPPIPEVANPRRARATPRR